MHGVSLSYLPHGVLVHDVSLSYLRHGVLVHGVSLSCLPLALRARLLARQSRRVIGE
jgi:hypothetical protein